jgi:hypothetical protein
LEKKIGKGQLGYVKEGEYILATRCEDGVLKGGPINLMRIFIYTGLLISDSPTAKGRTYARNH